MSRKRGRIQGEVGGWDDGHRIGADLGRVRGQRGGFGGGLRPAVDEQPAAEGGSEDDRGPSPLVGAEEDPLAGGAAGEDAVGAVSHQEADHWPDGGLVHTIASRGERGRGGHDERWTI